MTDLIEAVAAREGDFAKCKDLIEAGADVNAKDEDGDTALIISSYYGHKDIVELLLKHGADVNAKDQRGSTAIVWAARKGHTQTVEILEQAIQNKKGLEPTPKEIKMTDLIEAAREGDLAKCEELIEAGADVNAKDEGSDTALMGAVNNGHIEIVKLLLKHGADVNAKNNYNTTALLFATISGHTEIVEMLEQAEKKAKMTDLIEAARHGDLAKCEELIEDGADVNAKDEGSDTALIYASCNDQKEVVELLLKHGADVNAENMWGNTALVWASRYGHTEIVEMLEQAIQNKKGLEPTPDFRYLKQQVDELNKYIEQHDDYIKTFVEDNKVKLKIKTIITIGGNHNE